MHMDPMWMMKVLSVTKIGNYELGQTTSWRSDVSDQQQQQQQQRLMSVSNPDMAVVAILK